MTRRLLVMLAVLLLVAGLQMTRIRSWRVLNDVGAHRVLGVDVSTVLNLTRMLAGTTIAALLVVGVVAVVRGHFRHR